MNHEPRRDEDHHEVVMSSALTDEARRFQARAREAHGISREKRRSVNPAVLTQQGPRL